MITTETRRVGSAVGNLRAWLANGSAKILLVGVSCVGKTTIGGALAWSLGIEFIDLDEQIERAFGMPMGRIKQQFLGEYSYRVEAAEILKNVLSQNTKASFVMALPPSGLKDSFWRVLKKEDALIVALLDKPAHIVNRADFYDDDGNKLDVKLTESQRRRHIEEARKDIAYFGRSYVRANVRVHLEGAGVEESVEKLKGEVESWLVAASAIQPT